MGQLLSLPMLLVGIGLWSAAYRQRTASGNFVAAQ
jgi:prolipoprotein diacylglyceryltransferase